MLCSKHMHTKKYCTQEVQKISHLNQVIKISWITINTNIKISNLEHSKIIPLKVCQLLQLLLLGNQIILKLNIHMEGIHWIPALQLQRQTWELQTRYEQELQPLKAHQEKELQVPDYWYISTLIHNIIARKVTPRTPTHNSESYSENWYERCTTSIRCKKSKCLHQVPKTNPETQLYSSITGLNIIPFIQYQWSEWNGSDGKPHNIEGCWIH